MTDLNSGTNVRRAVLVAGMHRSGTSAATRVLSILGCTLPANLLAPSKGDNDRGFWESKRVMDLNNEMLESAGSYWDDWNFIREEWFDSPVARSYVARAVDVLVEETGEAPLIVVKDPRICRLMPVWIEAVEALGYTPSVLQPIRNPIEVAQSLMKRSQIDPAIGQLVWLRHVLDAEYHSRPHARSFVHYETLMTDWQSWISKVEHDFDMGFPRLSPAAEEEIGEFLEPGLWRNRAPDSLLKDSGNASIWVRDAYKVLRNWTAGKKSSKSESVLNRIRDELQEVTPAFVRPLHAYRRTRKAHEALTMDSDKLRKEFDVKASAVAHLESEAEALREKMTAQAEELATVRTGLAAVQKELETAKSELAAARSSHKAALDKATAEAAAERQARAAAEGRNTELSKANETFGNTLNSLRSEREKLQADLKVLYSSFDEANTEIAATKEALSKADARRAELEKSEGELKASLAKAEANGVALAEKNAGLEADLKALQTARAETESALKSSLAKAEANGVGLAEKNAALEADLNALQTARAETEAALKASLAKADAEGAGLAEQNAALEAELEALQAARAETESELKESLAKVEANGVALAEANAALEAVRAEKARLEAELKTSAEEAEAQKSAFTAEEARRGEVERALAEQATSWAETEQVLTTSLKEALARLSAAQGDLEAETKARRQAEDKVRSLTDQNSANEDVLKTSLREALARFSQTREALVSEEAGRHELTQMLERLRAEQLAAEAALQSALEEATAEAARNRDAIEASAAARGRLEEQVRILKADQATALKSLSAESQQVRNLQTRIDDLGRQLENEARRRKSTEEARFRESAALTRLAAQKDDESARLREIVLNILHALSSTEKTVSLRTLLVPARRKQAETDLRRQILVASGGFDADWYLANNPDVAASGIDAAEHYMTFGIFEGRLPHPMFDPAL
ncbi:MAG: hypothetical protein KDA53_11915 [Hyphomonas sp.]|nr:hypothetical protein [Hyphomonas sp.]